LLSRRRFPAARLFAGQFLIALLWMAYVQAHGNAVLGIYFYACFLLPFAFLAIGSWMWQALQSLATATYLSTCAAGVIFFGLAWLIAPSAVLPPFLALAGAIALGAALTLRAKPVAPLLALIGFVLLAAPAISQRYGGLQPRQLQQQFESIMQARSRIEAVRGGHAVRFWYDEKDRAAPDATALRSTYLWFSSLLADTFFKPCDAEVAPSTIVAVISADPDPESNFARPALAERTLDGCWASLGMRALAVETDTIHRESYDYTLSLLRVEAIPGAWQPVPPGPLPLENWTIAPGNDARAQLDSRADGIKLTTHAQPESIGAIYPPITAPETGLYRVCLRVWPGDGIVIFAARATTGDPAWLASTADPYWNGSDSDMVLWLRLTAGQQFQLTLSNHNGAVHRPATVLMQSLTVVRVAATSVDSPQTPAR